MEWDLILDALATTSRHFIIAIIAVYIGYLLVVD